MRHDALYDFFSRWAVWLPEGHEESFRAELALLACSEQARERRRLCTSASYYADALEETMREIAAQAGAEYNGIQTAPRGRFLVVTEPESGNTGMVALPAGIEDVTTWLHQTRARYGL